MCVCSFLNHEPARIYALIWWLGLFSFSLVKDSFSFLLLFLLFNKSDSLKSPGRLSYKLSNILDLSHGGLICVSSVHWKLSPKLDQIGLIFLAGILLSDAACVTVASHPEACGV